MSAEDPSLDPRPSSERDASPAEAAPSSSSEPPSSSVQAASSGQASSAVQAAASGQASSSPPPAGAGGETTGRPRNPRQHFVTMPTELRVFQTKDPNAGALAANDVAKRANDLRAAGRGPDVLFEAGEEPRKGPPSPNDNRSEHRIVEVGARSVKPASRPPASAPKDRRVWVGVALLFVAAAAFLIVRSAGDSANGSGSVASGTAAPSTTEPTGAGASGPQTMTPGAGGSMLTAVSTGTTTAQGPTMETSSTPTSTATGAQPKPTSTGAQPKATGTPAGTVVPTAEPTVSSSPTATTAPSVKPTGNPWDVVFEKKKESGN